MAELEKFDGILVPGGFGRRGVEGMLCAIRYARECKVPISESAWACRPCDRVRAQRVRASRRKLH